MKIKKFKNGKVKLTLENKEEKELITAYFAHSTDELLDHFNLEKGFLYKVYKEMGGSFDDGIPQLEIIRPK